MKKAALFAVSVLVLLSVFSCKEDEEEESTSESMSGAVEYDIPYYVLKGETVTMRASGITYPVEAKYKWYISGVYTDTLTSNVITVKFPDSLGVFTVSAVSYADGFYSNSTTQNVTTIDTCFNASLTGIVRSGKSITDSRDGHVYAYVTVGSRDWFSQNLAWQGSGVPFKSSPATASIFGSFYTWEEAVSGACPEGWYVPGHEDWEDLAAAVGGKTLPFIDNWAGLGAKLSAEAMFNDERMWPYSPDNVHSNDVGWNALPLGITTFDGKLFAGDNSYGYWWSATEKNGSQAYYRYIYYDQGSFPMSYAGKSDIRINVRCVRMHPQS